jgi:hypothetical protein
MPAKAVTSNFRAEIMTLTLSFEFVVLEAAALRFLLVVASGFARLILGESLQRSEPCPRSTNASLPQVSETANSTGLNRCLILYEFVSE